MVRAICFLTFRHALPAAFLELGCARWCVANRALADRVSCFFLNIAWFDRGKFD